MKTLYKFLLIILCFVFIYFNLKESEDLLNNIFNFQLIKILKIIIFCTFSIIIYSKLILITLRYVCNLEISNSKWNLIYFNSQFLNSIPFLGILYRAKKLKDLSLGYEKFFASYLMITWLYLFLSLLVISLEMFILIPNYKILNINSYFITLIASFCIVIIPLFLSNFFQLIFKNNLIKNQYLQKLRSLLLIFDITKLNVQFLKNFILFFIFLHILEILIIFDLLSGLKSDISFYKSFLIFFGVSLIDSINILPQNILVSDVGYGYVTKYLGENFQLGVIAKLYLRFLIFISSISIAIIYNVYIHLQRKIF